LVVPKGIANEGHLAERGAGQAQETEEPGLLAGQVLHQMTANAGQALERCGAHIQRERSGQIASKADPFGNEEGIQAISARIRQPWISA
jgi:hypothetical protein